MATRVKTFGALLRGGIPQKEVGISQKGWELHRRGWELHRREVGDFHATPITLATEKKGKVVR